MKWIAEYDHDTGEHRVHAESGDLICCVGNITMDWHRQEAIAKAIAEMRSEILRRSDAMLAARPAPGEGGKDE